MTLLVKMRANKSSKSLGIERELLNELENCIFALQKQAFLQNTAVIRSVFVLSQLGLILSKATVVSQCKVCLAENR